MTDYLIYDVFTDSAFGGNPLAIVTDAASLPEAQLQTIAREFNLSETVFLYPPADPAHTARARIFTPVSELPFAGHPTIGTAVALGALGRGSELVLELGVGPIACTVTGGAASFTSTVPLKVSTPVDPSLMAACVGLAPDAICADTHAPVMASVGLQFALAELTDMDALRAASPVTQAFRVCADAYPVKDDFFSAMVYVREGTTLFARMFAPLSNIPEDPATGSAAAALGCYLAELSGCSTRFEITQGVEMGRPSAISVAVEIADDKACSFTVSGQAVKVMEGRLCV
jgi:trans-2,3-dihydro-3-hydroxyanthranilate isomerase